MKITSKGQVTIPIQLRELAGLLPHTEVVFEFEPDGVKIRRAEDGEHRRGKLLTEHLRGRATVGMTTDEIMALTRGDRRCRTSTSAPTRRYGRTGC